MKITAGLGSIDDYLSFVNAGADELFCGYVPSWWTDQYGIYAPLNRREVLYYNVQIGSASEMEILHDMMDANHVPVSIALNALTYTPDQYPDLLRYIRECVDLGFPSFILADPGLLFYLSETDLLRTKQIQLSVSGEFGEMNELTLSWLHSYGIRRIIFHRKITPAEMKACAQFPDLEYEAFLLNENCHYHGGFCNSLHCDELTHMCHVPYQCYGTPLSSDSKSAQTERPAAQPAIAECDYAEEHYIPGYSGCGLCALWDLREAGITHLKIVGRGNYSDDMALDIKAVKKALRILSHSASKMDFLTNMKKTIFPYGCSQNCYYRST